MIPRKSTIFKAISLGLTVVLFATNCALAHSAQVNFWKERQKSVPTAPQLAMAQLPLPNLSTGRFEFLNPKKSSKSNFKLVSNLGFGASDLTPFGTVRKIISPRQTAGEQARTTRHEPRTIIHIQDIHMNHEAQANIGKAVEQLLKNGNVGLVALEGSSQFIDIAPFKEFPNQATVHKVADYLLSTNQISGPIHALLSVPSPVNVIGIDDEKHYQANIQAYKRAAPLAAELKAELKKSKSELNDQKRTMMNQRLYQFDQIVEAYRSGELSLVQYLYNLHPEKARIIADSDLDIFLQALLIEQSLDFRAVEAERTRLLEGLLLKLKKQQIDELVQVTTAYRLGNVTHTDFYTYIENLCAKCGIDLSRYQAMEEYIQYVLLSESIDGDKMFAQLKDLEMRTFAALAKTDEERKLVAQSRQLYLMGKLLDFGLTNEEWNEYKLSAVGSKPSVKPFENFYTEAEIRDQLMADKLLAESAKLKSDSLSVLVTGGFHSKGIDSVLSEAGFTVVTFVPKISKVETKNGSEYLSVFTQEKTPLQKLFEGQKLFLANNPLSPTMKQQAALQIAAADRTEDSRTLLEEAAHMNNVRYKASNSLVTIFASINNFSFKIILDTSKAAVPVIVGAKKTFSFGLQWPIRAYDVAVALPGGGSVSSTEWEWVGFFNPMLASGTTGAASVTAERVMPVLIRRGMHLRPTVALANLANTLRRVFRIQTTLQIVGQERVYTLDQPTFFVESEDLAAPYGSKLKISVSGPFSNEEMNWILDAYQTIVAKDLYHFPPNGLEIAEEHLGKHEVFREVIERQRGSSDSQADQGAWSANPTYVKYFAWWVEPAVSIGAGYVISSRYSSPTAQVIVGAFLTAYIFWAPHYLLRGKRTAGNSTVVFLTFMYAINAALFIYKGDDIGILCIAIALSLVLAAFHFHQNNKEAAPQQIDLDDFMQRHMPKATAIIHLRNDLEDEFGPIKSEAQVIVEFVHHLFSQPDRDNEENIKDITEDISTKSKASDFDLGDIGLDGPSLKIAGWLGKTPEEVLYKNWIEGSLLENFVSRIAITTNENQMLAGNLIFSDGRLRPFEINSQGADIVNIRSEGRGHSETLLWSILKDLKKRGFVNAFFYIKFSDHRTPNFNFFFGADEKSGIVNRWNKKLPPNTQIIISNESHLQRWTAVFPIHAMDFQLLRQEQGSWFANPTYVKYFAWWVEPAVAFAAAYMTGSPLAAGLVFWAPHVLRGPEMLRSPPVVFLALAYTAVAIPFCHWTPGNAQLVALILLYIASIYHFLLNNPGVAEMFSNPRSAARQLALELAQPILMQGDTPNPHTLIRVRNGVSIPTKEVLEKLANSVANDTVVSKQFLNDHQRELAQIKNEFFGTIQDHTTVIDPVMEAVFWCYLANKTDKAAVKAPENTEVSLLDIKKYLRSIQAINLVDYIAQMGPSSLDYVERFEALKNEIRNDQELRAAVRSIVIIAEILRSRAPKGPTYRFNRIVELLQNSFPIAQAIAVLAMTIVTDQFLRQQGIFIGWWLIPVAIGYWLITLMFKDIYRIQLPLSVPQLAFELAQPLQMSGKNKGRDPSRRGFLGGLGTDDLQDAINGLQQAIKTKQSLPAPKTQVTPERLAVFNREMVVRNIIASPLPENISKGLIEKMAEVQAVANDSERSRALRTVPEAEKFLNAERFRKTGELIEVLDRLIEKDSPTYQPETSPAQLPFDHSIRLDEKIPALTSEAITRELNSTKLVGKMLVDIREKAEIVYDLTGIALALSKSSLDQEERERRLAKSYGVQPAKTPALDELRRLLKQIENPDEVYFMGRIVKGLQSLVKNEFEKNSAAQLRSVSELLPTSEQDAWNHMIDEALRTDAILKSEAAPLVSRARYFIDQLNKNWLFKHDRALISIAHFSEDDPMVIVNHSVACEVKKPVGTFTTNGGRIPLYQIINPRQNNKPLSPERWYPMSEIAIPDNLFANHVPQLSVFKNLSLSAIKITYNTFLTTNKVDIDMLGILLQTHRHHLAFFGDNPAGHAKLTQTMIQELYLRDCWYALIHSIVEQDSGEKFRGVENIGAYIESYLATQVRQGKGDLLYPVLHDPNYQYTPIDQFKLGGIMLGVSAYCVSGALMEKPSMVIESGLDTLTKAAKQTDFAIGRSAFGLMLLAKELGLNTRPLNLASQDEVQRNEVEIWNQQILEKSDAELRSAFISIYNKINKRSFAEIGGNTRFAHLFDHLEAAELDPIRVEVQKRASAGAFPTELLALLDSKLPNSNQSGALKDAIYRLQKTSGFQTIRLQLLEGTIPKALEEIFSTLNMDEENALLDILLPAEPENTEVAQSLGLSTKFWTARWYREASMREEQIESRRKISVVWSEKYRTKENPRRWYKPGTWHPDSVLRLAGFVEEARRFILVEIISLFGTAAFVMAISGLASDLNIPYIWTIYSLAYLGVKFVVSQGYAENFATDFHKVLFTGKDYNPKPDQPLVLVPEIGTHKKTLELSEARKPLYRLAQYIGWMASIPQLAMVVITALRPSNEYAVIIMYALMGAVFGFYIAASIWHGIYSVNARHHGGTLATAGGQAHDPADAAAKSVVDGYVRSLSSVNGLDDLINKTDEFLSVSYDGTHTMREFLDASTESRARVSSQIGGVASVLIDGAFKQPNPPFESISMLGATAGELAPAISIAAQEHFVRWALGTSPKSETLMNKKPEADIESAVSQLNGFSNMVTPSKIDEKEKAIRKAIEDAAKPKKTISNASNTPSKKSTNAVKNGGVKAQVTVKAEEKLVEVEEPENVLTYARLRQAISKTLGSRQPRIQLLYEFIADDEIRNETVKQLERELTINQIVGPSGDVLTPEAETEIKRIIGSDDRQALMALIVYFEDEYGVRFPHLPRPHYLMKNKTERALSARMDQIFLRQFPNHRPFAEQLNRKFGISISDLFPVLAGSPETKVHYHYYLLQLIIALTMQHDTPDDAGALGSDLKQLIEQNPEMGTLLKEYSNLRIANEARLASPAPVTSLTTFSEKIVALLTPHVPVLQGERTIPVDTRSFIGLYAREWIAIQSGAGSDSGIFNKESVNRGVSAASPSPDYNRSQLKVASEKTLLLAKSLFTAIRKHPFIAQLILQYQAQMIRQDHTPYAEVQPHVVSYLKTNPEWGPAFMELVFQNVSPTSITDQLLKELHLISNPDILTSNHLRELFEFAKKGNSNRVQVISSFLDRQVFRKQLRDQIMDEFSVLFETEKQPITMPAMHELKVLLAGWETEPRHRQAAIIMFLEDAHGVRFSLLPRPKHLMRSRESFDLADELQTEFLAKFPAHQAICERLKTGAGIRIADLVGPFVETASSEIGINKYVSYLVETTLNAVGTEPADLEAHKASVHDLRTMLDSDPDFKAKATKYTNMRMAEETFLNEHYDHDMLSLRRKALAQEVHEYIVTVSPFFKTQHSKSTVDRLTNSYLAAGLMFIRLKSKLADNTKDEIARYTHRFRDKAEKMFVKEAFEELLKQANRSPYLAQRLMELSICHTVLKRENSWGEYLKTMTGLYQNNSTWSAPYQEALYRYIDIGWVSDSMQRMIADEEKRGPPLGMSTWLPYAQQYQDAVREGTDGEHKIPGILRRAAYAETTFQILFIEALSCVAFFAALYFTGYQWGDLSPPTLFAIAKYYVYAKIAATLIFSFLFATFFHPKLVYGQNLYSWSFSLLGFGPGSPRWRLLGAGLKYALLGMPLVTFFYVAEKHLRDNMRAHATGNLMYMAGATDGADRPYEDSLLGITDLRKHVSTEQNSLLSELMRKSAQIQSGNHPFFSTHRTGINDLKRLIQRLRNNRLLSPTLETIYLSYMCDASSMSTLANAENSFSIADIRQNLLSQYSKELFDEMHQAIAQPNDAASKEIRRTTMTDPKGYSATISIERVIQLLEMRGATPAPDVKKMMQMFFTPSRIAPRPTPHTVLGIPLKQADLNKGMSQPAQKLFNTMFMTLATRYLENIEQTDYDEIEAVLAACPAGQAINPQIYGIVARFYPHLLDHFTHPTPPPAPTKPPTILNSDGDSFYYVFARVRPILGDAQNPRKWPATKGVSPAFSLMSNAELGHALRQMITGKPPVIESLSHLAATHQDDTDLLRAFIDTMSIGANRNTELLHHLRKPLMLINTIESQIATERSEGVLDVQREATLNNLLQNAYRYRAFIREITFRWKQDIDQTAPDSSPLGMSTWLPYAQQYQNALREGRAGQEKIYSILAKGAYAEEWWLRTVPVELLTAGVTLLIMYGMGFHWGDVSPPVLFTLSKTYLITKVVFTLLYAFLFASVIHPHLVYGKNPNFITEVSLFDFSSGSPRWTLFYTALGYGTIALAPQAALFGMAYVDPMFIFSWSAAALAVILGAIMFFIIAESHLSHNAWAHEARKLMYMAGAKQKWVGAPTIKILIAEEMDKETPAQIEKLANRYRGRVQLINAPKDIGKDPEALAQLIKDEQPTIIVVRSGTVVFHPKEDKGGTKEFWELAEQNGLKVFIRAGVAFDNIDVDEAAKRNITVARTHGSADSVSDLSMRFLLDGVYMTNMAQTELAHGDDIAGNPEWKGIVNLGINDELLPAFKKSLGDKKRIGNMTTGIAEMIFQGVFGKTAPLMARRISNHLNMKTIGIVGTGQIAIAFIEKLNKLKELTGIPFDIQVTSESIDNGTPSAATLELAEKHNFKLVKKDELIQTSDIISLHIPDNAGSKNYLNVKNMKNSKAKVVINTAREPLVDPKLFDTEPAFHYYGDLDMTDQLVAIQKKHSTKAHLLPHIGASTPSALKGVLDMFIPTLEGTIAQLLGNKTSKTVEIVNKTPITKMESLYTPINETTVSGETYKRIMAIAGNVPPRANASVTLQLNEEGRTLTLRPYVSSDGRLHHWGYLTSDLPEAKTRPKRDKLLEHVHLLTTHYEDAINHSELEENLHAAIEQQAQDMFEASDPENDIRLKSSHLNKKRNNTAVLARRPHRVIYQERIEEPEEKVELTDEILDKLDGNVDRITSEFNPTRQQMKLLEKDFIAQIRDALNGFKNSLATILTHAVFPTGNEVDDVIVINWGGSNGRAFSVTLNGQKNGAGDYSVSEAVMVWEQDELKAMRANPDLVFGKIAEAIIKLTANHPQRHLRNYKIGFTYSFPHELKDLATALGGKMSKGWLEDALKGVDLGKRIEEELNKRGHKNFKVTAIANDTLSPLFTWLYRYSRSAGPDVRAFMGVILGTGFNIAANLGGTIYNLESGNYDGVKLIQNRYDLELDATRKDPKPGTQLMEKMVAGEYMGELCRLAFRDLRVSMLSKGLFKLANGSIMGQQDKFTSLHLSDVLSSDAAKISQVFYEMGASHWSREEKEAFKRLARAVVKRAARLIAMQFSAITKLADPNDELHHVIPIEGSVFWGVPGFPEMVREGLVELMGERANKISFSEMKDSMAAGVAVVSAAGASSISLPAVIQKTLPVVIGMLALGIAKTGFSFDFPSSSGGTPSFSPAPYFVITAIAIIVLIAVVVCHQQKTTDHFSFSWNRRKFDRSGRHKKHSTVKQQARERSAVGPIANPRFAEHLISAGTIEQEAGHYEKAETFFLRAIALTRHNSPSYFVANHALAFLYSDWGRFSEAIKLLEEQLHQFDMIRKLSKDGFIHNTINQQEPKTRTLLAQIHSKMEPSHPVKPYLLTTATESDAGLAGLDPKGFFTRVFYAPYKEFADFFHHDSFYKAHVTPETSDWHKFFIIAGIGFVTICMITPYCVGIVYGNDFYIREISAACLILGINAGARLKKIPKHGITFSNGTIVEVGPSLLDKWNIFIAYLTMWIPYMAGHTIWNFIIFWAPLSKSGYQVNGKTRLEPRKVEIVNKVLEELNIVQKASSSPLSDTQKQSIYDNPHAENIFFLLKGSGVDRPKAKKIVAAITGSRSTAKASGMQLVHASQNNTFLRKHGFNTAFISNPYVSIYIFPAWALQLLYSKTRPLRGLYATGEDWNRERRILHMPFRRWVKNMICAPIGHTAVILSANLAILGLKELEETLVHERVHHYLNRNPRTPLYLKTLNKLSTENEFIKAAFQMIRDLNFYDESEIAEEVLVDLIVQTSPRLRELIPSFVFRQLNNPDCDYKSMFADAWVKTAVTSKLVKQSHRIAEKVQGYLLSTVELPWKRLSNAESRQYFTDGAGQELQAIANYMIPGEELFIPVFHALQLIDRGAAQVMLAEDGRSVLTVTRDGVGLSKPFTSDYTSDNYAPILAAHTERKGKASAEIDPLTALADNFVQLLQAQESGTTIPAQQLAALWPVGSMTADGKGPLTSLSVPEQLRLEDEIKNRLKMINHTPSYDDARIAALYADGHQFENLDGIVANGKLLVDIKINNNQEGDEARRFIKRLMQQLPETELFIPIHSHAKKWVTPFIRGEGSKRVHFIESENGFYEGNKFDVGFAVAQVAATQGSVDGLIVGIQGEYSGSHRDLIEAGVKLVVLREFLDGFMGISVSDDIWGRIEAFTKTLMSA